MLPRDIENADLVIRSPQAVTHGVSRHQEEDDPENFIVRDAKDGCWYAPSDDGQMEYVGRDWTICWLLRCGYFGLAAMLDQEVLGERSPSHLRVVAGVLGRAHRPRHDPPAPQLPRLA